MVQNVVNAILLEVQRIISRQLQHYVMVIVMHNTMVGDYGNVSFSWITSNIK